ncbi:amidase family protein [Isoptericola variabilis]|uniref:amidase family protein n=1 Tax=Isoptericola variabilis TaxID=139208 RepID=UPI001C8F7BBC|nr:amidase family protein [Isoptericola variabilis]
MAAAPKPKPVALDLATAGVPEVRAGLTSGAFTSVDLVGAYLERIQAISIDGPHLNAVRAINPAVYQEARALDKERKAGTVRGPLHGVPVLLKDNIDVKGMPTTAGSIALGNSYPADDAPIVKELREAGAVILGKVNLSEFANFITSGMPSGYSSLGGQVLNPYDASQTPSGSSSGSGVAAATGMAPLTIGTETSGSILSPAQASSVVGVKPTVGLVSRTGIIPISASQDTAGPMVKTVYDAAALLSAIAGVDPEDAATTDNPLAGTDFTGVLTEDALDGARIGYVANNNPLYQDALAALEAQGATLVPVTVANTSAPSILVQEFKRDMNAYLDRLPDAAPMQTFDDIRQYNIDHPEGQKFGQLYFDLGAQVDLEDPEQLAAYEANRDRGIAETRAAIDSVLEKNDLDAIVSSSGTTGVGARAGYPSVSVPMGYAANNLRPSSIVFLGTAWAEPELLALAYDYEQATQLRRTPEEINPSLFRCVTVQDAWAAGCTTIPTHQGR